MITISDFRRMATWIACAAALTGCDTIYGSGRPFEETRDLPPFDSVVVAEGLAARVGIGPQEVSLRGDDNIVPEVLTTVDRGVLRISSDHDLEPDVPLDIVVTAPHVQEAAAESGAYLEVDIDADEITLRSDSGSAVVASGSVGQLNAIATSGSSLDAARLAAAWVMLQCESGSEMVVRASEGASGSVVSGSAATVLGWPAVRSVHSASGSEVSYE